MNGWLSGHSDSVLIVPIQLLCQ